MFGQLSLEIIVLLMLYTVSDGVITLNTDELVSQGDAE